MQNKENGLNEALAVQIHNISIRCGFSEIIILDFRLGWKFI